MTDTPSSVTGGALMDDGTKSRPTTSVVPPASMRERGSTAAVQSGSTWNQPPFSPAGSRPRRRNSAAT